MSNSILLVCLVPGKGLQAEQCDGSKKAPFTRHLPSTEKSSRSQRGPHIPSSQIRDLVGFPGGYSQKSMPAVQRGNTLCAHHRSYKIYEKFGEKAP